MSFEGKEDLDIKFGDIVPCDCSESSYGHINAFVERYCSPRYSFGNSLGNAHFGGTESRKYGQAIVEGGESKVSSVESWRPMSAGVEHREGLCLPEAHAVARVGSDVETIRLLRRAP